MSKLINKSIIQAMSIGISAVMTFGSMNLGAFAEESNPESHEPENPQVPEQAATESELTAALRLMGEQTEEVQTKTNTAVDSIVDAIETGDGLSRPTTDRKEKGVIIPGTISATQGLEDEFYDGDAVPAGQALEAATAGEAGGVVAEEVERRVPEEDQTPDIVEVVGELVEYAGETGAIDTQASVVEGIVGSADGYANAGNTAAAEADKLEEKANELLGIPEDDEVKDIVEIVADDRQIVEDAAVTIGNATIIPTAEGAIIAARGAAADADGKVNAIEAEVKQIEEDFAKYESDYETASGEYENKLTELNTAKNRLAALEGVASADAVAAKEELDRLEAEASKLQTAAEKAKEKYNSTGYAYIAALEKAIQDKVDRGESVPYTDYRQLAIATMRFYYVPDVLGGNNAKVSPWENNPEYDPANIQKVNGKDVYVYDNQEPDGDTIGDVLKYGKCTYTDKQGQQQTICFNWKTLDKNQYGTQSGIVIFEKVDHVSIEGKDVPQNILDAIGREGEYFDEDTNRVYVQIGETNGVKQYAYFDVSTTGETETKVTEVEASEDDLNALLSGERTEEVVDVAIGTEHVDYNYDSTTGEVTKTVTADVTTTTYTGASLDGEAASSAKYADLTAAQNAYKQALQEKINALGDNESIVIGDVEFKKGDTATLAGFDVDDALTGNYIVTGTYCPVFPGTIEVEAWGITNDVAEFNYYVKAELTKVGDIISNAVDFDQKVLSYDIQKPEVEDDGFADSHAYGGVDVTYLKVVTETRPYSIVEDVIRRITGNANGVITKADIKKYYERQGYIVYNVVGLDLNVGEATVYYVKADTLNETVAASSAAEANGKVQAQADKYNVKIAETNPEKVYGYKALNYLLKKVDVDTAAEISSAVWSDIKEGSESYTEKRNDNWYDNKILLSTVDQEDGTDYTTDKKGEKVLSDDDAAQTADFRSKVDAAAAVATEYVTLANKASKAQEDIRLAKAEIETLKGQIDALPTVDAKTLNAFSASLAAAQAKLAKAKSDRDDLLKRLAEVEALFSAKVAELTPSEVVTTGTTTDIENPVAPLAAVPGVLQAAPAPAPAAPAAPANAGNQDNNAGDEDQNTENIGDEEAALAGDLGDGGNKIENIGDEESALSMGLDEVAPKRRWNWWWLLIVAAVTGGTTYGIIKGNQKKKEENKEV